MKIKLYCGEEYLEEIEAANLPQLRTALTGWVFREYVNQTLGRYSLRLDGGDVIAEAWYDSGTAHEEGESWDEIVDAMLEDVDIF
jgi:hypothetical protein